MMTMLSNIWASGIASAAAHRRDARHASRRRRTPRTPCRCPTGARAACVFEDVIVPLRRRAATTPCCEDINLRGRARARRSPSWAPPAPGKSTLVNLIPRFYDVTAGRVLDRRHRRPRASRRTRCWRTIGIVPQETILFSGTVRDNIRYGRPDASDEEVIARRHRPPRRTTSSSALPAGLRHATSRSAARTSPAARSSASPSPARCSSQPKILILDDSTSSVDVETETQIQDALDGDHARPHQLRRRAAHQHGAQRRQDRRPRQGPHRRRRARTAS